MVLEYTAAAALGTVRAAAIPAATQTAGLSRGIEQDATYAPLAADQLEEAIGAARVLVAVELVAAVRAIRLRGLPVPSSARRRLAGLRRNCRPRCTTGISPEDVRLAERLLDLLAPFGLDTGDDQAQTQQEVRRLNQQPDSQDGRIVTDALHFPLMFSRDGLDPIAELGERRATEPVSKLELPFGITAWLVTGYDAAKEVLGDPASFSNAFGNLTTSGTDDEQDPGGLGMTDPPYHTRLRKMLTPEFTMRRLNRLQAADRGDRRSATGRHRSRPASRRTWWRPSRCRFRRW